MWAAPGVEAVFIAVVAALHREKGGDPLRDLTPMMLRARATDLRHPACAWLARMHMDNADARATRGTPRTTPPRCQQVVRVAALQAAATV